MYLAIFIACQSSVINTYYKNVQNYLNWLGKYSRLSFSEWALSNVLPPSIKESSNLYFNHHIGIPLNLKYQCRLLYLLVLFCSKRPTIWKMSISMIIFLPSNKAWANNQNNFPRAIFCLMLPSIISIILSI